MNSESSRYLNFQEHSSPYEDLCHVILYEMLLEPIKLSAKSSISKEWNQLICPSNKFNNPDGTLAPPFEPEYIKEGLYRYSFGFYLGKNKTGLHTVYSNTFRID